MMNSVGVITAIGAAVSAAIPNSSPNLVNPNPPSRATNTPTTTQQNSSQNVGNQNSNVIPTTMTPTITNPSQSITTPTSQPHAPTTTITTTPSAAAAAAASITTTKKQTITSNGSLSDSITSTEGHRTPNVDSLSKTNLYIRGLQSNTSDQDLYNMCARFGQISSTKAILDKATGLCRGYGFVEFTSPQSAELAVQELTKSGIQAQMAKISPLYSSHHNHHHHNHHHHSNNNNNHHHNSNNHHHSHNHQQQHHHQYHHPHHHTINNHNNSNPSHNSSSGGSSSNNNGSITSAHATSSVSNNPSGQQQHQQHYQSSPNSNNADPTNLYIANLPPNMSEQELENLLSNYGPVVSTRILRDQDNIPRGVGFARMESRDKCEQIIEHLNGRPFKGSNEPLLVKFADGGTKKRQHHNNHHHQHHNNSHHQHHKSHQDDNRWRDSGNTSDIGGVPNFEHQSNIPHNNHLPDLAMMGTMNYPRMQPGFPPNVGPGSAYQPHLGPPTSAPQWIPAGPGQPYVIPHTQLMQAPNLGPSNQAAAAALHYGHIPQLTSQMQGLQIAHPGAPVGGYLPPQHQWSTLWTHTIPAQPQPQMRIPTAMQPHPSPQQQSPQTTPVQQQPTPQHQSSVPDNKLQVTMPI